MKTLSLIIALLLSTFAYPALGDEDSKDALIEKWAEAHLNCRADYSDEGKMREYCGRNDAFVEALEVLGYCHKRDMVEVFVRKPSEQNARNVFGECHNKS